MVVPELFSLIPSMFSFFSNTFLGGGGEAKRILATGRPATATVLAIGENSGGGVVTINDQPYVNLKLKIDDGQAPPYEVSFDTVIARTDVPLFQPGAMFAVKIDPKNPKKITIDVQASQKQTQPTVGGHNWSKEDHKLLEEKGIDGVAKLMAVEDTCRSQDMQPLIKLTYEVAAPELGTYSLSREIPMPTNIAQQFKSVVGKTFPAHILPTDHTKIIVDVKFS
jgi:hypothetical protein